MCGGMKELGTLVILGLLPAMGMFFTALPLVSCWPARALRLKTDNLGMIGHPLTTDTHRLPWSWSI